MKVIVHYNIVDPTRKLIDSMKFIYSKPFDSLDAAHEWLETTQEAIMNVRFEITD